MCNFQILFDLNDDSNLTRSGGKQPAKTTRMGPTKDGNGDSSYHVQAINGHLWEHAGISLPGTILPQGPTFNQFVHFLDFKLLRNFTLSSTHC